jgi:AcrR family transcriptional regulator
MIARGAPPDIACRVLNISRETARNQLKSVFAKTNTHRQSELVALLRQNETNTKQLIVEAAKCLYRRIGFQATRADIARELHMSPANIHRFFAAKSDIYAAVCTDLLGKIEAEAKQVAASGGTANAKNRQLDRFRRKDTSQSIFVRP